MFNLEVSKLPPGFNRFRLRGSKTKTRNFHPYLEYEGDITFQLSVPLGTLWVLSRLWTRYKHEIGYGRRQRSNMG